MNPNVQVSAKPMDIIPYTPVPVIASFDTQGRITPLYVRLHGEAHRILSYWVRNPQFLNVVDYSCKIEDNGFEKPLLLRYYYTESTWVVGAYNGTTEVPVSWKSDTR